MTSKYEFKPSMGAEIIRMAKEGYLKCEIASALGIPLRFISQWKREYEEFAEIMELAETHQMAWWCMRGRTNLENPRFNFYLWYSVMKNSHGWADKPTERNLEFEDWKGTFIEKINSLDQMLATGKCSSEMYEKMMKSLSAHANINEIIYIQPEIAKMELDRQLKAGEITEAEHVIKMTYIDRSNMIRELAAENIFKEEKLYSKFNCKQSRKVPKAVREKKKEALANTEVTVVTSPVNPLFDDRARDMREKRMKKLGLDQKNLDESLEELEDSE
jgi:hypothetical protein